MPQNGAQILDIDSYSCYILAELNVQIILITLSNQSVYMNN